VTHIWYFKGVPMHRLSPLTLPERWIRTADAGAGRGPRPAPVAGARIVDAGWPMIGGVAVWGSWARLHEGEISHWVRNVDAEIPRTGASR
jgi:hypothetical protein